MGPMAKSCTALTTKWHDWTSLIGLKVEVQEITAGKKHRPAQISRPTASPTSKSHRSIDREKDSDGTDGISSSSSLSQRSLPSAHENPRSPTPVPPARGHSRAIVSQSETDFLMDTFANWKTPTICSTPDHFEPFEKQQGFAMNTTQPISRSRRNSPSSHGDIPVLLQTSAVREDDTDAKSSKSIPSERSKHTTSPDAPIHVMARTGKKTDSASSQPEILSQESEKFFRSSGKALKSEITRPRTAGARVTGQTEPTTITLYSSLPSQSTSYGTGKSPPPVEKTSPDRPRKLVGTKVDRTSANKSNLSRPRALTAQSPDSPKLQDSAALQKAPVLPWRYNTDLLMDTLSSLDTSSVESVIEQSRSKVQALKVQRDLTLPSQGTKRNIDTLPSSGNALTIDEPPLQPANPLTKAQNEALLKENARLRAALLIFMVNS